MDRQKINIVCFGLDDNPVFLRTIDLILAKTGISGHKLFAKSSDMLAELHEDVHICLIDHILEEDITGIDVLIEVLKQNPFCFVIGMSAGECPKIITAFVNNGGRRYILKNDPYFADHLCAYVKEGIEATMLRFSDEHVFRCMVENSEELLTLISSHAG